MDSSSKMIKATVKIVYNRQIRRTTVLLNEAKLFEELVSLSRSLFSELTKFTFDFEWRDDDNDAITISSSQECAEAIRYMQEKHISSLRLLVINPFRREEESESGDVIPTAFKLKYHEFDGVLSGAYLVYRCYQVEKSMVHFLTLKNTGTTAWPHGSSIIGSLKMLGETERTNNIVKSVVSLKPGELCDVFIDAPMSPPSSYKLSWGLASSSGLMLCSLPSIEDSLPQVHPNLQISPCQLSTALPEASDVETSPHQISPPLPLSLDGPLVHSVLCSSASPPHSNRNPLREDYSGYSDDEFEAFPTSLSLVLDASTGEVIPQGQIQGEGEEAYSFHFDEYVSPRREVSVWEKELRLIRGMGFNLPVNLLVSLLAKYLAVPMRYEERDMQTLVNHLLLLQA
jgi:hypothetical protein